MRIEPPAVTLHPRTTSLTPNLANISYLKIAHLISGQEDTFIVFCFAASKQADILASYIKIGLTLIFVGCSH